MSDWVAQKMTTPQKLLIVWACSLRILFSAKSFCWCKFLPFLKDIEWQPRDTIIKFLGVITDWATKRWWDVCETEQPLYPSHYNYSFYGKMQPFRLFYLFGSFHIKCSFYAFSQSFSDATLQEKVVGRHELTHSRGTSPCDYLRWDAKIKCCRQFT